MSRWALSSIDATSTEKPPPISAPRRQRARTQLARVRNDNRNVPVLLISGYLSVVRVPAGVAEERDQPCCFRIGQYHGGFDGTVKGEPYASRLAKPAPQHDQRREITLRSAAAQCGAKGLLCGTHLRIPPALLITVGDQTSAAGSDGEAGEMVAAGVRRGGMRCQSACEIEMHR